MTPQQAYIIDTISDAISYLRQYERYAEEMRATGRGFTPSGQFSVESLLAQLHQAITETRYMGGKLTMDVTKNGFNGDEYHAVVAWHDADGVAHVDRGYVVRTAYLQEDGTHWIPRPYDRAYIVRVYKREYAAQRLADRLNGHGGN